MKAVIITSPGSPDVLQYTECPRPDIQEGEVLVRVKAAGVNRPDVIQRQGKYPAPPGVSADIPGLEVAGIVEAVKGINLRWRPGDQVCALVGGGGYAEYVNVPAGQVLPVPRQFTFAEAASLPETFFTVWTNVFDRAEFKKGERFLVHGGTSGIGVAAIQMVKARGGMVYATAGSDEKCRFIEGLGAKAVNYKVEDFEEAIKASTQGEGVDVILDMIGGSYAAKNLNLLRVGGRLVMINAMKGRLAEIDLLQVMRKRLIITGSTLRSREISFKQAIAEQLEQHIWPLLEDKTIKPIIYKTFPLEKAAEAHQLMESSEHIGKIILEV